MQYRLLDKSVEECSIIENVLDKYCIPYRVEEKRQIILGLFSSVITTYDIIDGLKLNDEYSKEVFEVWQNDLITGLIGLVNIFDPESIVISGGMGQFINTEQAEDKINSEIVVSPVKVKLAKSGNNAGMIGSAMLAVEKY